MEGKFEAQFEELMSLRRDQMKALYNRVLPSGEYIFNRFDKARYLRCGERSSIYDTAVVMGDVEIGSDVWIGPFTLLEGANAKLKIGNYVSINAGTMIYTHDSTKKYLTGGSEPVKTGPVSIGDNTVIGSMSIVTCGVSIGRQCVIGANSFVNEDIPDRSIAMGSPAVIVGEVVIKNNRVDFVYHQKK